ncbi:hypothetical protein SDC9_198455 [bioreactor metagenome]|uniref:Uncharacterized protein n=1 Tax=bioreactor metagenome TaxID=1076179 RepID=A0A645IIK7_9ZZZZ
MYQHQHGNGRTDQLRNKGNGQKANNGEHHSDGISYKNINSGLIDLLLAGQRLHVLIHDRYGWQLEQKIKECSPQRRAKGAAVFGCHAHRAACHLRKRVADGTPLRHNVGHQNNNQAQNNQHRKGSGSFTHHRGAIKCYNGDKHADNKGAKPVG